jgi:hypothetical protein
MNTNIIPVERDRGISAKRRTMYHGIRKEPEQSYPEGWIGAVV